METINTHNVRIDTGKHRGELFTRLPVSYLRWMVRIGHSNADLAEAELERRGTVVTDIDITPHAINRTSLKCLDAWEKDRNENEGLHAWLCRVSGECLGLIKGGKDGNMKMKYKGIIMVFEVSNGYPVLKTVMKGK